MGDGKPRIRFQGPQEEVMELLRRERGVTLLLKGLSVEVYSTLPQRMVPELLRSVADRVEQELMEELFEEDWERKPLPRHG